MSLQGVHLVPSFRDRCTSRLSHATSLWSRHSSHDRSRVLSRRASAILPRSRTRSTISGIADHASREISRTSTVFHPGD